MSGANYNPAVSFALALRGALPYKDALFYAATQFLASVVAGCVCLLVFIDDVQKKKPKHAALEEEERGSGGVYGFGVIGHPSVNTERFSLLSAFTAEAAYTFALCFVVLNVATTKQDKAVASNQFFGLAVGFTVMAGACSAGPVSGGAFNPAVGFGLPLCAGEFEFIPLYLMGPLTGAAIASFFYYLTNFKVIICKPDFLTNNIRLTWCFLPTPHFLHRSSRPSELACLFLEEQKHHHHKGPVECRSNLFL